MIYTNVFSGLYADNFFMTQIWIIKSKWKQNLICFPIAFIWFFFFNLINLKFILIKYFLMAWLRKENLLLKLLISFEKKKKIDHYSYFAVLIHSIKLLFKISFLSITYQNNSTLSVSLDINSELNSFQWESDVKVLNELARYNKFCNYWMNHGTFFLKSFCLYFVFYHSFSKPKDICLDEK